MIVISYRAAGGGDYTQLDASGLHPIYSGWKPRMERHPQVEPAYNSPGAIVRATGNSIYTAQIQSVTAHASEAAAMAYLVAQLTGIPELVDLEIVDGADTYYMPAAVFSLFESEEQTGVSNTIKYTFVGNLLTTTAP